MVKKGQLNNFFFILPAKKIFPRNNSVFKSFAIKIGFLAFAIALLIKTASQPISIAIVASEAVPIPASIITGIFECFNN